MPSLTERFEQLEHDLLAQPMRIAVNGKPAICYLALRA